MVLKQEVSSDESCLVVHLFEAAMNLAPCNVVASEVMVSDTRR